MKNNAQVIIESTVGIMVLLFLVIAIFKIFIWFNLRLVERQEAYKQTAANFINRMVEHPVREGVYITYGQPQLDFYNITDERKLQIFP